MLGNNADAFFTTPMRTSVRQGGNASFAAGGGMPAPYAPGGSATQEFLPGVGDDAPTQIAAETKKFLGVGVPVAVGILALGFLFLTEPGARMRAKLGV